MYFYMDTNMYVNMYLLVYYCCMYHASSRISHSGSDHPFGLRKQHVWVPGLIMHYDYNVTSIDTADNEQ